MRQKQRKQPLLLLSVILIIAVVLVYWYTLQPKETNENLIVYFIDTGQSDCVLLETPNGSFILIDSGDNGDEDIIRKFLNNKKVKEIECAIFTHPHADHIGGAYEIVNEYATKRVLMPDVSADTATYKKFIDEVSAQEIPLNHIEVGYSFVIDTVAFNVFSPKAEGYGSKLNEYSIVCRVDYGDTSFLFTGDAEIKNEMEMLDGGFDLDVDVLKVGHHGSSTSSSLVFLKAVTPEYAVILCGTNNKYGHPHDETLSKLEEVSATIYRTDINGTITITTDGKTIDVILDEQNSQVYNWQNTQKAGKILPFVYFTITPIGL